MSTTRSEQSKPTDGGDSVELLLVDVKELAIMLSVSPRTVWRMVSAGELMEPVRPRPGMARWKTEAVRRWIEEGCPPQKNGDNDRGKRGA